MSSKIAVRIKKKPCTELSKSVLYDPHGTDITELVRLCRKHKIFIRGGKNMICRDLLRQLHGVHVDIVSPEEKIYKAFVQYFLWKLGNGADLSKCENTLDFYTSARIPKAFLFCARTSSPLSPESTQDSNASSPRYHAFDIRSLNVYRDITGDYNNPMMGETTKFDQDTIDRIERKNKWLRRFGFIDRYHKPTLSMSPEDRLYQTTVNTFSHITQYHYVDYMWFHKLSFNDIKQLYHEMFEIWNYRLPIEPSYKVEIVPDTVFSDWTRVSRYGVAEKDRLRLEVLDNITKLVSSGISEDHCKTGCHIFMLGFVLVSQEAADSYPQLFQASYIDDSE